MRKLINDPRHVAREMLEGLADTLPGLALLEEENVLLRADLPAGGLRDKVALISGGGSGHEPAHAGYIGHGMLDAAAVGDVFTSPSVDTVLAAIRAVAGPRGVLLIIKNYTGDRLNFGLAAELARAEGIAVDSVVVADDVALRDTVEPARRRGIAGTVLVHKIAGAAAAAGAGLAEVAAAARLAAEQVATMGVALGACTVPATGRPGFQLDEDEIELGLGIHGEAGVRRAPRQSADALCATLLDAIVQDRDWRPGQRVAMLVNGLGGTPPMELAIVARSALASARQRGLRVERLWSGNFMTALEMPGCSLSLLALDEQRLSWLDQATQAPAWPGSGRLPAQRQLRPAPPRAETAPSSAKADPRLRAAAWAAADALDAAEALLTELDGAAGDGDLGVSMQRGAAAIRALPDSAWSEPATALRAVGQALRQAIAGSSGPFYSTALLRAARRLDAASAPGPRDWAAAFQDGVAAIAELGGAQLGDRTMLDALSPAADAFASALDAGQDPASAWRSALEAAERGCAATVAMRPRLGRASYLGERALGVPDAGASAALVWLKALAG
ncbi:dihydroxyacetone kinase [Chromobacterium alkanivorans]|uniref:dihydroxyacetone kinase family protein n=1 Tax=Chromobacterium alkanivorans TaxID=1071719 RepID=UPI0021695188|nr:dihydroxyacetone kinase family protein [Chromobacterium alkanivorans]MCS3806309.1 dihydroxyacetone kinase [Chromobacterium alkanivorans]MCS3820679.1 dihydroxyacetone kinase [Chromobacterium alkanivorans]MCS3875437.1 dihydroxyacetone kinase [Chromobacterium alkanivorans]